MRDFILLESAGLIALPEYLNEEKFYKIQTSGWMLYNHYGGGW